MELSAAPILYVMTRDPLRALGFWRDVLGAEVLLDRNPVLRLRLGAQMIDLVRTEELTPSPHPLIGLPVADIEAASAGLAAKGVTFQAYPGLTEGPFQICTHGAIRLNWFADPDGNLLGLVEGGA